MKAVFRYLENQSRKVRPRTGCGVYLTDEFSGSPQMVLFDYERDPCGDIILVNFLGNRFHGYLTCDGYQAYHSLGEGIIISGCLTHARRRFDAALTALKKRLHKKNS